MESWGIQYDPCKYNCNMMGNTFKFWQHIDSMFAPCVQHINIAVSKVQQHMYSTFAVCMQLIHIKHHQNNLLNIYVN